MKTYKVSVTLDYYVEAKNEDMADFTIGSALNYSCLPTTSYGDDEIELENTEYWLKTHLGSDFSLVGRVVGLPHCYSTKIKEV